MAIDLTAAPEVPAVSLPDLSEFLDFAAAGSDAAGDYRCADCGYGAVVQKTLPACPMCQGTVWERREPRTPLFPY